MKALLLIGSPRSRSASESLGTYLTERLAARGWECSRAKALTVTTSERRTDALLADVSSSDLLVLAFPLYIDSLPTPLLRVLQLLAEKRAGGGRRLAAIVNSGFPEGAQNDTALAICRRFAAEAGFEWAGGVALGGGGAVAGKRLQEAGGLVARVMEGLDVAAEALAEGRDIPESASRLVSKPLMPSWLYILGGAFGWYQLARKQRALWHLRARPYAR